VAALGFGAQPPQRSVGVAAERVHQDPLGLVDDRAGHDGVLELAGGSLRLAVGGRVREHRAAERGQHVRRGAGLLVEHAGMHAEQ
jgi:hypothetical protein